MNKFIIMAIVFCTFAIGCKKKNTAPPEPAISFVGMDKQEVHAGNAKDTVYLQLGFTDGDGDLVGGSITFVDNRDSTTTPYPFPDDIPIVVGDGARGNIYVFLSAAFMLNRTDTVHKNRDTVIYKVYMRDAAGHESNRVEMLPIYLNQ